MVDVRTTVALVLAGFFLMILVGCTSDATPNAGCPDTAAPYPEDPPEGFSPGPSGDVFVSEDEVQCRPCPGASGVPEGRAKPTCGKFVWTNKIAEFERIQSAPPLADPIGDCIQDLYNDLVRTEGGTPEAWQVDEIRSTCEDPYRNYPDPNNP